MDEFDFEASGLTEILLDRKHRVAISQAAFDLYVTGLGWSVRSGDTPGFITDEHLGALEVETTLTSVELWILGLWERGEDGYRVCDVNDVDTLREVLERFKALGNRPEEDLPPAVT